ncbi:MAG: glycoside hydrolase family 3 C-terminal domain-containing protein, partial [Salinibacterium sp.]|nr:glycoside hydrolase family 3 C-terminal domain-containing protein [Salinibacterium sp.]
DSTEAIVAAVQSGELEQAVLDAAAARIAQLAEKTQAAKRQDHRHPAKLAEAHHVLAREAAAESIVLLRNERAILPLATDQSIAVIGEFARSPRYQGAGSSQVRATSVDTALEALSQLAKVEFAAGYSFDRNSHAQALIDEAVTAARRAEVALLFVGLPDGAESEGFDRTHLELPAAQRELLAAVAAANRNTVVILTNGGVVSLEPWHDSVPVIIEAWLLGQAGGSALADVLYGRIVPSGRLAESIPYRLQDTPAYLNFPGENDVVRYGEGVFVGYRYYESVDLPVRYPFGHGLSYSSFEYSKLSANQSEASLTVTNTGRRAAKHVVQLYIAPPPSEVARPKRELRAFCKIELDPGESRRVRIKLDPRDFAHWDTRTSGWRVSGGDYLIEIGHNSHHIALSETVAIVGPPPERLSLDSRIADFLAHPVTGPILARAARGAASQPEGGTSLLDMVASMPMRRLMRFPGVGKSLAGLPALIAIANNPFVRGLASWWQRRRAA